MKATFRLFIALNSYIKWEILFNYTASVCVCVADISHTSDSQHFNFKTEVLMSQNWSNLHNAYEKALMHTMRYILTEAKVNCLYKKSGAFFFYE